MAHISLKNASLDFPIYGVKHRSIKLSFANYLTGGKLALDVRDRISITALSDISADIPAGQRVGLYGHNGSGKTTLLRVLSGIYQPTRGTVEVSGKIASMLSVSLGMETEATGYENIRLRGTLQGLGKRAIDALVDDVQEFCELGDFLQLPLRTYSSGMSMRLAFAIATHITADIILMDEWLSVGDANFVNKAEERLRGLNDRASIVVIASHNRALLDSVCQRIITLENGCVTSDTNSEQKSIQVP